VSWTRCPARWCNRPYDEPTTGIVLTPGDGIGTEVLPPARRVPKAHVLFYDFYDGTAWFLPLSSAYMTAAAHRSEHDLLGHHDVPAEACWGVHTLRARENFAITGTPIAAYPHLIDALATVKEAASRAMNKRDLG
jgi:aspartate ammonia-lyase